MEKRRKRPRGASSIPIKRGELLTLEEIRSSIELLGGLDVQEVDMQGDVRILILILFDESLFVVR